VVYRFAVDNDGQLSGKTTFIEIERGAGCPDGSTVDADGCIWVALYGGGAVRRYSPKGSLIAVVPLPCPNVTKLAFGGRDLKTAFVTTARTGMTAEDLHAHPDAGGLFLSESMFRACLSSALLSLEDVLYKNGAGVRLPLGTPRW